MTFCSEGYQLMGICFCRDSVFICLLLPENMIICDKCLSKCWKGAKLNVVTKHGVIAVLINELH